MSALLEADIDADRVRTMYNYGFYVRKERLSERYSLREAQKYGVSERPAGDILSAT